MPNKLDDFSDAPLTASENKTIRKIIRDQERMDWFWASARIWVGYGAAITAALYAGWDYIAKVFRALAS